MTFVKSAFNDPLISRTDLHEAVARGLCLYVGRGRRYSVKQLSNATGVPDRQIECAKIDPNGRQGDDWRALKTEEIFSVAKFLGQGFTSEILGLCGQAAYDLPPEDDLSLSALTADCAEDTADVAELAADRKIDRRDESILRAIAHRFVERGMMMVAFVGRRKRSVAA